jgi:hypothetical protein
MKAADLLVHGKETCLIVFEAFSGMRKRSR